jgi:23S rRNA pseudouridine1911/1915/1917 synthase
MNEIIKFVCGDEISSTNSRLDNFLTIKFSDYSRTYFQKLIKDGFIKVNDSIIKKSSFLLKEGDSVSVEFPPVKQFDLTPTKVDFEVIDIQDDFVVINKPPGLMVHPAASAKDQITLVHGLLYKFKELSNFENIERPGIVHRLDKDTSGVMVVARNIPAQIKLAAAFKDRKVKKIYLALVEGHPQKTGKIDFSIGRHPKLSYKMSHLGFNSRPALTRYKVLEYFKDCALVEVQIFTGRTHQIRVHFSAIGHSVLADIVYGKSSKLIERQALHAQELEFELDGKKYSYKADLLQDFKLLLEKIKD